MCVQVFKTQHCRMLVSPRQDVQHVCVCVCVWLWICPRSVALDVVKDMTKQRFKAYVQQAQKERDRRNAAQVLKKLVQVRPYTALLMCAAPTLYQGHERCIDTVYR